jgi:hypothetical protein
MHLIILICAIWLKGASLLEGGNHALYLSLTEVDIAKDSMKVVVKVFSDDLSDALKNHAPAEYQPADLTLFFSDNETVATDYFNDKLKLFADQSRLNLVLDGHTVEGDAHFITFQSKHSKSIKSLSVEATFLMELFPTQLNVVEINSGGSTHFLKFTNESGPQSVNLRH